MRRALAVSGLVAASFLAGFAGTAAAAVPECTGTYSQKTIYTGQNQLENVIVGGGGTLYTSGADATGTKSVLNAYRPGTGPTVVTDGPSGPGGLAWNGRKLLWGYGNSALNGATGDLKPSAGLNSVSISTGKKTLVSDRLGMANGIARGKDGSVFASNALGRKLDRISPTGKTTNGWATVATANGLTVGKNGRYLYANQIGATPSSIAKIDVDDPSKVYTWFRSPDPANYLFDGLARDGQNNLYVAVFALGQVWKVNPQKQACVVASGLKTTSGVAISSAKKGFRKGNLYVVGFDGNIIEVKGAASATVPG